MNSLIRRDYEYLRQKLEGQEVRRLNTSKQLAEAAAHGGATLSKIPEFAGLMEELKVIDSSIDSMGMSLQAASVVEFEDIDDSVIGDYSLVHVSYSDTGDTSSYYILDPVVGDILKIDDDVFIASPNSPLGSALLGKKVGDIIELMLPKGTRTLRIESFHKKLYLLQNTEPTTEAC